MSDIIILMSTFNGEKYLKAQIDSLLSQEEVDVTVIIRDDGSTDLTKSIIKEYIRRFRYKIILIEGENIGWKRSFFTLIEYAYKHYLNYQYFAFADQDDIWLPDKLSAAVNALNTLAPGPNIYFSNQYFYKSGINYGLVRKKKIITTFKKCLVRNYATGCTMVFNKELLSLAGSHLPSISVAHDYWMFQVAMLCGKVYYDSEAYILYRQHENNQIGCKSSWFDIWKRRINGIKTTFKDHRMENQTKELLQLFGHSMDNDAKCAVSKMSDYRKSIKNRLQLLLDNGYTLDHWSNDLLLKTKILFGIL